MKTIEDQDIVGQQILIGRDRYLRCRFSNCTLTFDGTPDQNRDCIYEDSEFVIEGAALATVQFLYDIWQAGGFNVVEGFGLAATGGHARINFLPPA
jgi:hypothetical protein